MLRELKLFFPFFTAPPAGYGYGAPPPPGYGPGYGPGYAQPSQSMFGGGDPAYPPNQYPPPKY